MDQHPRLSTTETDSESSSPGIRPGSSPKRRIKFCADTITENPESVSLPRPNSALTGRPESRQVSMAPIAEDTPSNHFIQCYADVVDEAITALNLGSDQVLQVILKSKELVSSLQEDLSLLRAENQALRHRLEDPGTPVGRMRGPSIDSTAVERIDIPLGRPASAVGPEKAPPALLGARLGTPEPRAPIMDLPGSMPNAAPSKNPSQIRSNSEVHLQSVDLEDFAPIHSLEEIREPKAMHVAFASAEPVEFAISRVSRLSADTDVSSHAWGSHRGSTLSFKHAEDDDSDWKSRVQPSKRQTILTKLRASHWNGGSIQGNTQKAFAVCSIWEKMESKQRFGRFKNMKRQQSFGNQALAKLAFDAVSDEESDEDAPSANYRETVNDHMLVLKSTGFWSYVTISPISMKRTSWDLMSLLLVVYDMILLPLEFFEPDETTFTLIMAWVTRLFWTADMPMSACSGYVKGDGTMELRPKFIWWRYFTTWFLMDTVIVGVDWLEVILNTTGGLGKSARMGKATRTFRIIRMVRLLRLIRMREVLALITERFYSETLMILADIVKIVVIMIAFAHFIACLWYGISASQTTDESWLVYYQFKDEPMAARYSISMHWSLSQFAGGMDEVTPENTDERAFAIIIFILAFMLASVFVSRITSSMTQLHIIGSQQSQKCAVLRRYLRQNGISNKLAMRVQRNASHALAEEAKMMPEQNVELLLLISEPLHMELHFEMYNPILSVHPFFKAYVAECPAVMRKVCHTAVTMKRISGGDVIFSVGEIPSNPCMFVVYSGRLTYRSLERDTYEVNAGEWISEAALWTKWVYHGVCTAIDECRLCVLDAEKFQSIASQFGHSDFDPKAYAQDFVDWLNQNLDDISDLPLEADFFENMDDFDLTSQASNVVQTKVKKNRNSDGFVMRKLKHLLGGTRRASAFRRSHHAHANRKYPARTKTLEADFDHMPSEA